MHINKLARPDSVLRKLLAHARAVEALNQALKECLEPPLDRHCQVANLTPQRLVLHARSPSWATRLRFAIPQLLECLREYTGLRLNCQVQLRVRSSQVGVAMMPAKSRPLHLSEKSATVIRNAALAIDNPDLQRALLRVASHTPRVR